MEEAKTLKKLYEQGLEIVETNNLYGAPRKIPKNQSESFNEMMRQNIYPAIYKRWWDTAESYFSNNSLNFLRFKKKIYAIESSSDYDVGHAGYLLTALDELEKMIDKPSYSEAYKLSAKRVQRWPGVDYKNGVIRQGDKFHKFSNEAAINMLNKLWIKRRIIQPDKTTVSMGEVTAWSEFTKTIDSNKGTAQAINKSMREKGITLSVIYPKRLNGLLLIATQKRTN